MTCKEIKIEAKRQLGNKNWSSAIGICIIVLSVSILSMLIDKVLKLSFGVNVLQLMNLGISSTSYVMYSALYSIFNIILTLVSIVLAFGVLRWGLSVASGNTTPITEIFYYFKTSKMIIKSVLFTLNVGIRALGWGILVLFLPIFLCSMYAHFLIVPVSVVFGIAYFILVLRYFLASFLFIINDDYNTNKCISLSCEIWKTQWLRLVKFELSFILWIISCIFVIPMLYVIPYMQVSMCVLAKDIINSLNEKNNDENYVNNYCLN